jgi:diguanylate cyclase
MFNYTTAHDTRARGVRFTKRTYRLRMLGTLLCMLPIATVLYENNISSPLLNTALFLNGIVWPHVAFYLSSRSEEPAKAEFTNLILDSAFGGFWIAIIGMSPIPAAILVTLITADKLIAGGWYLLQRGSLALIATCIVAWTLRGFPFYPALTTNSFLATLPFLFCYCICLSYFSYRQGRKIVLQNKELERLNRTDTNIELPNRRFFETRTSDALETHRQTGQVFSLLLIDIDYFKDINDTYGHSQGDEVLAEVAEILRTTCRAHDIPARYGGDEFAILLSHADLRRATAIGERIRAKVGQLTFDSCPGLTCTTSIGVTQISTQFNTLAEWVAATDVALYCAKAAGRNQVVGQASTTPA